MRLILSNIDAAKIVRPAPVFRGKRKKGSLISACVMVSWGKLCVVMSVATLLVGVSVFYGNLGGDRGGGGFCPPISFSILLR